MHRQVDPKWKCGGSRRAGQAAIADFGIAPSLPYVYAALPILALSFSVKRISNRACLPCLYFLGKHRIVGRERKIGRQLNIRRTLSSSTPNDHDELRSGLPGDSYALLLDALASTGLFVPAARFLRLELVFPDPGLGVTTT
ncbi:hypothetical protein B0H16DRAFT_1886250 [Mycena metata]|uniref:Uncharacterized protein n=1 Tax=Mycena metata TaxID=1033252 RepID=A0AAD7J5E0_9AGAR|nr:hypothetical protein B0H16DRAFT_1886250 [Mycena metata]